MRLLYVVEFFVEPTPVPRWGTIVGTSGCHQKSPPHHKVLHVNKNVFVLCLLSSPPPVPKWGTIVRTSGCHQKSSPNPKSTPFLKLHTLLAFYVSPKKYVFSIQSYKSCKSVWPGESAGGYWGNRPGQPGGPCPLGC